MQPWDMRQPQRAAAHRLTFNLAATCVAAYTAASATNGSQFVNIVSMRMDGGLAGASALACNARGGGQTYSPCVQDQAGALADSSR